MQTSVIKHRVADFLKSCAPFDAVSEPDLLELAGSGRVKFHESEEDIFRQGDAPGQLVWVIQQGRVELFDATDSGPQLRDVLGAGDVLGLERFAGDGRCLHTARTASDVILYGVTASLFGALIPRYPALKRFLMAHFSVSGVAALGAASWLDAQPPPMDFLRARLVTLPADASAEQIAHGLTQSNNGTIALVDSQGRITQVVTPIDICAASNGGPRPSAWATAAPPTTRAAVRQMLHARAEHIAITADGTPSAPLEAILTASELALFSGHNPVRLIRAIERSGSTAEIVPLLREAGRLVREGLAQPSDVEDCCRIATEVLAAVAGACIRQAHASVLAAGIDPPGVPYCWLLFGDSARGDLLETALPTIAAVYDDSSANYRPDDSAYFTALAGETMSLFQACGLTGPGLNWPDGSQPCMPLSEWKRLYRQTIRNPLGHELYLRREFFDLRVLSGDPSLRQALERQILCELSEHAIAIPLLANDTLANLPPLAFFHGLVLDLDGEARTTFDIERTAISPIADAARVFAIASGRLAPANTLERLDAAALDIPESAGVFRDAAAAFRTALYYRTVAGRTVAPDKLGRFDQRLLKTAFSSIQQMLEFTSARFIPST